MWHFSDFQHGLKSSLSTTDFLTVKNYRTAETFNRSGATQVVALAIFKIFDEV